MTPLRFGASTSLARRVLVVLAGGPLVWLATQTTACGDESHVFEGRLFLEGRKCLGTNASVDVVEGSPPGSCGPRCLSQHHADGGRSLYVSTMCGPFPFDFDSSGTDPGCGDALAALARNDTCLLDGGSSAPGAVGDASPTSDAADE